MVQSIGLRYAFTIYATEVKIDFHLFNHGMQGTNNNSRLPNLSTP